MLYFDTVLKLVLGLLALLVVTRLLGKKKWASLPHSILFMPFF